MVKRKPGEDKITDDAFEAEMKALMVKQEAVKPPEAQGQEFKKGGCLPKYNDGGFGLSNRDRYSMDSANNFGGNNPRGFYNPNAFSQSGFQTNISPSTAINDRLGPVNYNKELQDVISNYDAQNQTSPQRSFSPISIEQEQEVFDSTETLMKNMKMADELGLDFNKERTTDVVNRSADPQFNEPGSNTSQYNPTASLLGPALSIGTSAISSAILANNAKSRKSDLLRSIGSPRVQAQKVDFSRDRSNIRANQALSESTGRQVSKGARSASEASTIQNQGRLSSQRVAGNQLSQSLQREAIENARLRGVADNANLNLKNQENRQKLAIEQQYGDAPAQIGADFARTTGQSVQNYLGENQRMRDFYAQANMLNPNFEIDFQENFESLTPRQQRLRRLGIGSVAYKKKLT